MNKITFELYMEGELVGHENHAADPDLGGLMGIYHNPLGSSLLAGKPVTAGDRNYIHHDAKVLVVETESGKLTVTTPKAAEERPPLEVTAKRLGAIEVTTKNLHEQRLSDLFELAAMDVQRMRSHGVTIHMARYFMEDSISCSVCLGGAALMGFLHDLDLASMRRFYAAFGMTSSQVDEFRLTEMVQMFDAFRLGDLTGVFVHHIKMVAGKLPRGATSDADERVKAVIEAGGMKFWRLNYQGYLTGYRADELVLDLMGFSRMLRDLGM